MPWAAQLVAEHQSFNERPAVVRACGSDCEEFASAAREDHVLLADVSQKHFSIGKTICRDSLAEIRSVPAFHISPVRMLNAGTFHLTFTVMLSVTASKMMVVVFWWELRIVLEREPEVTRYSPNAMVCSDMHKRIGPTIMREESSRCA